MSWEHLYLLSFCEGLSDPQKKSMACSRAQRCCYDLFWVEHQILLQAGSPFFFFLYPPTPGHVNISNAQIFNPLSHEILKNLRMHFSNTLLKQTELWN